MNWKTIILVVHICFLGFSAIGQNEPKHINGVSFGKAVNYVNCQYAILALTQSTVVGVRKSFQDGCTCSDTDLSTIQIKDALVNAFSGKNQADLQNVLKLIDRIDALHDDHLPTDILLLNEAVSDLTSRNLIIDSKGYLKPTEGLDKHILLLRDELTEMLSKEVVSPPTPIKTDDSDPLPKVEKIEIDHNKTALSYSSIILFCLSIFTILLIVLLTLKHRRDLTELKQNISESLNTLESKLTGSLKKNEYPLRDNSKKKNPSHIDQKAYEQLKRRMDILEVEVSNLERKTTQFDTPVEMQIRGIVQTRTKSIFFASSPVNEKFSKRHSTKDYMEGRSIYVFTSENSNKATFQVVDKTAAMRMAIGSRGTNIEPVSQWENVCKPNHEAIKTLEPGIAELRGDEWIVTKKAIIRYV